MSGSDRLMYNPTKHWNFKGWKSMNSSRGYSHRGGGGGDWYKQHYSDKDKYSKTHYHNQSKFRLQNTPRSMFQSGPPLASDRRAKRDSVKLAHKLKSTLTSSESSSSGSSSDKKHLVKENGHPNGFSRSETSVHKNKSIEDAKKSLNSIKIVNVTSEHKENISTAKSSSDKKGKEGTSEILKSKRVKIIRERPATVTKECEVVDLDDDNTDSQESRISYNSIIEKIIDDDDDTDCIITEEMVPRKETPVCEPISEMQIKIVNIGTSHEDALEQDNCETVMEVDDSSSQSECDVIEQNDESGPSVVEQASISDNAENAQEMKNSTDNSNEVPVTEDTNEEDKEDEEEEKGDEEENEDEEDVEDEEDEEEKGEEKEKEDVEEEEEEKQKVEEEKEIEKETEKETEKANGNEIESEKLVAEEKESEQEKEAGSEKEKEIEEKETEQEKEAPKEIEQEQEKEKETEQEEKELEQDKELEQEKELLEEKNEVTDKINENEKEEDSANKDTSEKKSEEAKEDSTNDKVQDSETEVSENQAEEKENTENTATSAAEEANEAVDAQSEAGSPQPLMIDETDGTESNDAKPENKDNEAAPPKSPSPSDNVEKQTEATSQNESESKTKNSTEKPEKEDEKQTSEVAEKDGNVLEDVDMTEDTQMEAPVSAKNGSDADKVKDDIADSTSNSSNETSSTVPIGEQEEKKASEENGHPVLLKKRRRKRRNVEVPPFNGDENETRQKRRSALNAEEIIRKDLKNDEDDDDSSDESYKLANNKKLSQSSNKGAAAGGSNSQPRPVSPPSSLKRTFDDLSSADVDAGDDDSNVFDRTSDSGAVTKKLRSEEVVAAAGESKKTATKSKETPAKMKDLVRQITQEDIRKKVKNLSAEDLEAMLLQKIVECITIRGEMGKLREQARSSKRTLEATRTKCQQLQKQVEGFEMVLKRLTFDKNINPEKYVAPIKINRSVGLQVNFQSEHGMQNLKQIQAIRSAAATRAAATSTIASQIQDSTNRLTSPKKIMKTRSPRRPDVPTSTVGQISGMSAVVSSVPTVSSTSALVSNKLLETSNKRPITLQNAGNIVQILQPNQQSQTVVVNRQVLRTTSSTTTVSSTNDLIDLTDEEDKSKSPAVQTANRVPTRVYQAVSASGVSLAGATNLRLVTTNSQTSPNTIVNNINGQKVTYGTVVMNGNKQLLLTSNQLRQVSSVQGKNITALYNKQGIPTLANGQTLRVLQPATTVQAQILRHPAALPETPSPVVSNSTWKLPPPAPSLKISKVATGIVLSWNMVLTDKFATIVSYQLFAYQEVAGTAPSPSLWKKVGDVRALPLPMACTLTQFTEGNNYHFAVRAVDEHTRYGQYSKPGNISL